MMIFEIPKHILVDVFANWLEIIDIGKLDSACCNTAQRERLHKLFDCNQLVFSTADKSRESFNKIFLKWLVLRKVRIDHITFPYRDKNMEYGYSNCELMSISAGHLLKINFQDFKKSMSFMVSHMCHNLIAVDFSKAIGFKGSIREVLIGCKKIKTLGLSKCQAMRSKIFKSILLPELISIDLDESNVDDATLVSMSKACIALQTLTLRQCKGISDAGVCAVAKRCTSLNKLVLFGCRTLTDYAISSIAMSCTSLNSLTISNCVLLTDVSVIDIVTNCKQLRSFAMSGLQNLTDAAYFAVAENCPLLHILHCECSKATDIAVQAVASKCLHLHTFYVGYNVLLTDAGVASIAKGCKRLIELNIERLDVTDAALCHIANHCQNLQWLDISSCTLFTNKGIFAFANKCRNLRVLAYSATTATIITPLAQIFWQNKNKKLQFVLKANNISG